MLKIDDAPVTVVIPCFCCTRTIQRALDSVVQQTHRPAEVILVDDASRDNTLDMLWRIQKQYLGWIKVISLEENAGAGSARNVGWSAATQPYIAFLDADDAWHPNKIEIQYGYMSANPELILCGHKHKVLKELNMCADWKLGPIRATPVHKWLLLLSNRFVTPSVMVKSDIHQRFIDGRRHMEDHLLWLEIVCDGRRVEMLSIDLAATYKMSYGVGGLSADIWKMEQSELENYRVLRERGHLSLISSYSLMLFSILKFSRRLFIVFIWWVLNKK